MSIHISSTRSYLVIFAALLLLTITTVLVAYRDLGRVNDIVALSIAVTKMVLVILFFMHAKFSTRLTKMVVVSAFVWLLILITFTLTDYLTRGWFGVSGK